MMKVHLVLGFSSVLASVALAGGGVDDTRHAPFHSPRHSGVGRVPFTATNVQLHGWKTLSDFPAGNTSGNDCWR